MTHNNDDKRAVGLWNAAPGSREDRSCMPARTVAGKSVLVMDDELVIRMVMRLMLESCGYEVTLVRNGEEALKCYREAMSCGSPFRAVMLDLNVPDGMGGGDTVRELLQIDPEVKAIVASGDTENPAMKHFRKFGFCGAISKPFSLEELEDTLRKVSENAESPDRPLLH